MEPSGSTLCPDVNARGEQKRQIKLTVKALENRIIGLQADRKAKVNKIKAAVREIKGLMQTGNNVTSVESHLENLSVLLGNAGQLHDAVIQLLPQEEQEKQNAWFSSILKYNSGFGEDVKMWRSDASRQTVTQMSTNDVTLPQSHTPHTESVDAQNDENESCVSKHSEDGAAFAVPVDDVDPSDSVSNVASRTSKRRGSAGSKSSVSSTLSARIKAEVDMAALTARQRLLKGQTCFRRARGAAKKKEREA